MNYFTLIGLTSNTIGSTLLAVALNKTIKSYGSSINALEIFKDTLLKGGDITSIQGLDKHRNDALKSASTLTNWGLLFLLFGFVLQLVSLL